MPRCGYGVGKPDPRVTRSKPYWSSETPQPLKFACFVTGMNTDHAEEQKKLFRLFEAWKYGKCVVKRLCCPHHLQRQFLSCGRRLNRISPRSEAWHAGRHFHQEWESYKVVAYKCLCIKLGKDRPNALTPEQQCYAALFIWGGCCMHKEMNSVKGGNA
jgi:hypothetical protein